MVAVLFFSLSDNNIVNLLLYSHDRFDVKDSNEVWVNMLQGKQLNIERTNLALRGFSHSERLSSLTGPGSIPNNPFRTIQVELTE